MKPKEAAKVELGGEDGNNSLVANRTGLLRLAAELLSAATAPLAPNREVVRHPGELGYLFVKGRGFINTIARTERVELQEPPLTRLEKIKNRALSVLALVILLFLIASTVTGCTVIIEHVF